jgi:MFS family permease
MAQSSAQQTLRRLTVIVAIQWMGATLGLPLLPLFLEHRDGTPSVIGLIMASFFVAGVATQFGFGHLADRFGRRKLLVFSLIIYGLASMTYLLPVSAPWLALTRMFQGASAGAIEVTSMSAVASLFPEAQRGRAVSQILAAQLFGIAIGPVAGVVASVHDLGWAFFVTGILSLCAAVVASRTNLGDLDYDPTPLPRLKWSPQLTGALVAAGASGLVIGVYEATWSLLMHAHHASTLQIRLSWTFFSVPWFLLARVGGWLADHANRRFIAFAGLLNGAFFL